MVTVLVVVVLVMHGHGGVLDRALEDGNLAGTFIVAAEAVRDWRVVCRHPSQRHLLVATAVACRVAQVHSSSSDRLYGLPGDSHVLA